MSRAGVQLVNWFSVACELHRDWRNDIEGLGNLLAGYIPDYKNLMTSYAATKNGASISSEKTPAIASA
jgi:hypothetical protein